MPIDRIQQRAPRLRSAEVARLRVGVGGLAFLSTLLLGVAGCGEGRDPDAVAAVPAAGTVKVKGQPLDQGSIRFIPDKGPPALGKIEGGKFTLTTYKDGDGAIPGTHKVAVISMKEVPSKTKGGEPEQVSAIPKNYAIPAESGITVDIPDGGKKDIDINLN